MTIVRSNIIPQIEKRSGSTNPPLITTTALPNAQQNSQYSFTMSAVGGVPPYTWSISSASPDTGNWLSIDPAAGTLSGTPTTAELEAVRIRVTDSLNAPTAPTAFSLLVTASSGGALAFKTINVGIGTAGVPLSTQIQAMGGSGNYTFTLAAPFTPAIGLSLTSSGQIVGTPTQIVNGTTTPSSCAFSVRVTDNVTAATATANYNLPIFAQPPLNYLAPTDQTNRLEPSPVPSAGSAGTVIVDDISGWRILRVTDPNTDSVAKPNQWFVNGDGSAEVPRFSVFNNFFVVVGANGGAYFYSFNKANFTATKLSPGGKDFFSLLGCMFDPVIDTQAWGCTNTQAVKLDVPSGTQTVVVDWSAVMATNGAKFVGSVVVADNGNMAQLIGSQDTTSLVGIVIQGVQHVLDASVGTIDGNPISGWPASTPTKTMHNVRLAQDGRWLKITMTASNPLIVIVVDLYNNTAVVATGVVGHQASAWGQLVNGQGNNTPCTYAAQFLIRDTTTQAGANNPTIIFPAPTGQAGGAGDTYASWGNQRQNMKAPFLETDNGVEVNGSGFYPNQVFGPVNGAYERELMMVATDGSQKVWRICHNFGYYNFYSAQGAQTGSGFFYDEVFAQLSRDGLYGLFCSNWANTLGFYTTTASNRQDVFLIEMKPTLQWWAWNSVWNTPIPSGAFTSPMSNSAAVMTAYQTAGQNVTTAFNPQTGAFTAALAVAPTGTSNTTWSFTYSTSGQWTFPAIPATGAVATQLVNIESWFAGQSDTDRSICLLSTDQNQIYDIYPDTATTGGNGPIAIVTASVRPLNGAGWWNQANFTTLSSGTASGASQVGGSIRPDEWAAGVINHALMGAYPNFLDGQNPSSPDSPGGGFIYPARATDGFAGSGSTDARWLPEGARLQLDPSLTDAQLTALGVPTAMLPVCHALQKYGWYCIDQDGNFSAQIKFMSTNPNASAGFNGPYTGAAALPLALMAHMAWIQGPYLVGSSGLGTGVSVTGTAGQCAYTKNYGSGDGLVHVGDIVTVYPAQPFGTTPGTGGLQGFAPGLNMGVRQWWAGVSYLVSAATSTTFTLQTLAGTAITSTVGTMNCYFTTNMALDSPDSAIASGFLRQGP